MIKKMISFLVRLIPRKYHRAFLRTCFNNFKIEPLQYAYNSLGILNWQNDKLSGEDFFLKSVLSSFFEPKTSKIIFDVGANKGDYTLKLANFFPQDRIYSFEPLPSAYRIAQNKTKGFSNVKLFPLGLGANNTSSNIYSYRNNHSSQHASLHREVFTDIHKDNEIDTFNVELNTVNDFCSDHQLNHINFLKIDTEGYEYEVLKGAKQMLEENRIDFVQFEFNEMNVISRVFFKDYFDFFDKIGYRLYRLNTNSLIPISQYDSILEVFKFQNFIATKENLD